VPPFPPVPPTRSRTIWRFSPQFFPWIPLIQLLHTCVDDESEPCFQINSTAYTTTGNRINVWVRRLNQTPAIQRWRRHIQATWAWRYPHRSPSADPSKSDRYYREEQGRPAELLLSGKCVRIRDGHPRRLDDR
jgi:hypothetical protein